MLVSQPERRSSATAAFARSAVAPCGTAAASCSVPRPGSEAAKNSSGCATRLGAVLAQIFGTRSSVQTTIETASSANSATNQGEVKTRKKPSRSKMPRSGPRVGS